MSSSVHIDRLTISNLCDSATSEVRVLRASEKMQIRFPRKLPLERYSRLPDRNEAPNPQPSTESEWPTYFADPSIGISLFASDTCYLKLPLPSLREGR